MTDEDHDLLVKLDVKLDMMAATLNEARLSVGGKADSAQIEQRISKLESTTNDRFTRGDNKHDALSIKVYMLVGGVVAIEVLLKFIPITH
jgi:hypothetical protein